MTRPRIQGMGSEMVRAVVAHLAAFVADEAAFVGVLVFAFDEAGVRAVGWTSIAVLLPAVVVSPLVVWSIARFPPARVRSVGHLIQSVGHLVAAAGIAFGAPLVAVVVSVMIAQAASASLRPALAVVLPSTARSPKELILGNLWTANASNASAMLGPLLATAGLAINGPGAVLLACGVITGMGGIVVTVGSVAHHATHAAGPGVDDGLRDALRAIRRRQGALGVLTVAITQYLVFGVFGVLAVAIADTLDLGAAGPGILNVLLGTGGVAAGIVVTIVARRRALAPILGLALTGAAVATAALGTWLEFSVALVAVPLLGSCRTTLDASSRILLQRSAAPRSLGSVFVILEMGAALGRIAGAVLAQVLLAVSGPRATLLGLAAVVVLVLVSSWPALRHADASADVPVVEMSLLRRLPMLAPLPALELESLARACSYVETTADTVVIVEGDVGDRFYAVVDGAFDVTIGGRFVRTVSRGDCFGEIALIADVVRTATVVSAGPGTLLSADREAFLEAVTGSSTGHRLAWDRVQSLRLATDDRPSSSGRP